MSGTESEDIDAALDARRTQLRISWTEVARRARMSTTNLARIRKGDIGVSWEAADGIDDALLWERGRGIQAVLAGKPPVEITPERQPDVDTTASPTVGYGQPPERPVMGTSEWLFYYRDLLGETDFREVRNVLLRMLKAEARVIELEQEIAERGEPPRASSG